MPVFIVDRLIVNLHERVIPDWDIRKIRRLFFEIETQPNFNQFFGKRVISRVFDLIYKTNRTKNSFINFQCNLINNNKKVY